jgi:hypothetical protein
MNKNKIKEEIEQIKNKLVSLEQLLSDKVDEEDEEEEKEKKEEKEEEEEKEGKGKDKDEIKEVLASLDKVAEILENYNTPEMLKLAFEIDKIADELEGKDASALKYDKDEPYMEKHFKGGVIEKDKDEDYLKEFNTDISEEVEKAYDKSKEASLPYSLI